MVAVRLSDNENCYISLILKCTFKNFTSLKSGILMVCHSLIESVFVSWCFIKYRCILRIMAARI